MDPKRWQPALLAVLAVCTAFVAWQTVGSWLDPTRPGWSGLSFEMNVSDEGPSLRVDYVAPLSPASAAGLEIGDRVIAINGRAPSGATGLFDVLRGLRPGDTARYTIVRNDARRGIGVRLIDPLSRVSNIAEIALNLIAGLLFLAVGSFVYWKRPADARALIFFTLCSFSGIVHLIWTGPIYAYVFSFGGHLLLIAAGLGLTFLIFPLLLHFCLVFPRRRPVLERHPKALRWIYGLPAGAGVLLAVLAAAVLGIQTGPHGGYFHVVRFVSPYMEDLAKRPAPVLGLLSLVLLAAVAALLRSWRRALHPRGFKSAVIERPALTILSGIILPAFALAAAEFIAFAFGAPAGVRDAVLVAVVIVFVLEIAACLAFQWLFTPIAACVALYRSYRDGTLEEKQQMRWPLWGLIAAVSAYFLARPLGQVLVWVFHVAPETPRFALIHHVARDFQRAALVLVPVSFAFAILKHRLMEINVYIRKTVIYGAASTLLGVLYLGLIAGLGGLITQWIGARSDWVPIGSTLLVAVAFVPVRNRVQIVLDRRFFRRRRDYPAALRALTAAHATDLRRFLDGALARIQQAVQNRSIVAFIRPEGERAFIASAKIGVPDEILDRHIAPSEATTHSISLLDERQADEAGLAGIGHAPLLVVPLRCRGELLGFLTLGPKLSDEDFDSEDRDFIASAAVQVAVGLDNLRLAQQQREFERAREIQEALLPRSIPQTAGIDIAAIWQPARVVGGDYYDVFELGDGRLALLIADVAGKGIAAALLMSNLQAAVRALASGLRSPAALCARLNGTLCATVPQGSFITFFYAILDAGASAVVSTNAGHNAPILCRGSGEIVRLETGGPVLGVLKNAVYEEQELVLTPGDRLLLFTDGVSEAFNASDEEFGEDRLAALVRAAPASRAEELDRTILESVSDFCGGNFHDDATLVVLTVHGVGAAAANQT